jgi:very-short-patch-repair endonuclease
MNRSRNFDALVTAIAKLRAQEMKDCGRDLFQLPFPGSEGLVPRQLAERFTDLDAAFGATISLSLKSEYPTRIEPLASAIDLCESPIEAKFLLALICSCALNNQAISILDDEEEEIFGFRGVHGDMVILVRPQQEIGFYRVDFGLELTFTHPAHELAWMAGDLPPRGIHEQASEKLAVECDGHDFHEKTAEQAKRDKSRDRELLNEGYPVMRFTGTEISSDPLKCTDQVVRDFFGINKGLG